MLAQVRPAAARPVLAQGPLRSRRRPADGYSLAGRCVARCVGMFFEPFVLLRASGSLSLKLAKIVSHKVVDAES